MAPLDHITAILRAALGGAIKDSGSTFTAAADSGADSIDKSLSSGLFGGGISLDDILLMIPGLGEVLTAPEAIISGLFSKAGKFVLGVASGWALGEFIAEALRPVYSQIVQDINQTFPSQPLDAVTAARTAARGITGLSDSQTEASRTGINGDRFNHLYHDALTGPSLVETLELIRRGFLDDADITEALQRNAIDPAWFGRLLELQRNLLSPADLALSFLRSDMTKEAMYAYGDKLGVDNADMDTLVSNTGEPPGLMELLEAYRRGFIDQPTLVHGIEQSRVRNEWIPTVEKLRYSPMSTSDAVRAVVENYLTTADAATIADQNGLQPGHIDYLIKSWGRPLAHQEMGSLVHRGLANMAQYDQAMRESDLKDQYIGLSFDTTVPLLPERLIVSAIHYNAITLQEGSTMLLQHGYSPASVSVLLKLGLREAAGAAHELTRAEITSLYADGGLSKAQALQQLETLGYSAQVAEYVIEIVDLKAHAADLRAEVSAIRVNYLASAIDAVQATTELKALGLTDAQAAEDIGVWDKERRRATKSLSEAQIVKAAKEGTFKPTEAISLLEAIGYSRANAVTLLQSNGVAVV